MTAVAAPPVTVPLSGAMGYFTIETSNIVNRRISQSAKSLL